MAKPEGGRLLVCERRIVGLKLHPKAGTKYRQHHKREIEMEKKKREEEEIGELG